MTSSTEGDRVTEWVKASSDGNGTCIEMRRNGSLIEIRDTKDRKGPSLRFTPLEVEAMLDNPQIFRELL